MLIGQFVDAVVVGIEAQPQHAEHKDGPLRHTGPPDVRAGFARSTYPVGQPLVEEGENTLA